MNMDPLVLESYGCDRKCASGAVPLKICEAAMHYYHRTDLGVACYAINN